MAEEPLQQPGSSSAREVRAPQSNADFSAVPEPGLDRIRAEATSPTGGTMSFSNAQVRRARDVLARLYGLRRARRLYPLEHPAVAESSAQLFEVIASYHAEGVDVPFTFFEDEVLLGDEILPEDSVLFDQLIRDMISIGAGSVTFERGLSLQELSRFALVLGARPEDVEATEGGLPALVKQADAAHITVSAVSVVREDTAVSEESPAESAKLEYTNALDLLREVERLIASNQPLNPTHIKSTARSLVDGVLNNRFAMLGLSGLKSFDEYTFYHCINVAILSLALGSMLTRDYRFLSSLGVGALLHDIGKMSVDIAVLNKTTPLTSAEWAEIREHPVRGAEITATTSGIDRASMICVLEHHMRYDLTGYPSRRPERRQHIASRIVAVADAYDAMTSQRPYSAPRMQDEAMNIIVEGAGTALDPALVHLFVNMLGYFPPRSVVELSTGEVAVVKAPNPSHPTRPIVRVIADSSGALVDAFDVDLSSEPRSGGRSAVRCLDPSGMNVDIADFL